MHIDLQGLRTSEVHLGELQITNIFVQGIDVKICPLIVETNKLLRIPDNVVRTVYMYMYILNWTWLFDVFMAKIN